MRYTGEIGACQPVLVDFWGPSAAPCRQLTPILEKLVKAAEGKVKLVKMNIEAHPEIAGQLGIQSIPAVIAFQRGQPVDGFVGALPESQVKGFIRRVSSGPLVQRSRGRTELEAAAKQLWRPTMRRPRRNCSARRSKSIPLLSKPAPGSSERKSRSVISKQSPRRARRCTGLVREPARYCAYQPRHVPPSNSPNRRARSAISAISKRGSKPTPNDHQARFDLALALNGHGRREEAADALLDIIRRDRQWNDDGARKQLVQFFEAWGHMQPETVAARRKLSTALFS